MKLIKSLPNILTIVRFILVPVIVLSIFKEQYLLSIILYIISSLTDVIDGYIARKFDAVSVFGKLMDPLADKLTQLSTMLSFAITGVIPYWITLIFIVKEIFMIAGASFLYGKNLVVSSKWYGKLTTVLIFIAVLSSLLINIFDLYPFDIYIYIVAIIFAIYSAISYFLYFYKQGYLPKKEEMKKPSNLANQK